MKLIKLSFYLISFIIVFQGCQKQIEKQKKQYFITAKGNKLYNGENEFRFLSFNVPTLNFIEDEMAFTKPHAFRLPTSFETRDVFESINQLGGQVVRSYTLPVRRSTDTLGIPRYVLGPGEFDENSFLVMDTVLALANEYDVKLIIPLLNNWKWMGGVPQYEKFRRKEAGEFWTDLQLIEDFKKTVEFTLNRTNTVTGIKYKDDKAIMCWETGNELTCPYSWTKEIVSYIKSIDKNHLVMDGYHAIDSTPIPEESINDTLIDIITSHHYVLDPRQIIKDIDRKLENIDKKKPYVIGEYGFLGTKAIEQVTQHIINKDISGGLIWSLRRHREEGGFYWHQEPLGGGIFKAFHWPGFNSGIEYNEKEFFKMYRRKAFEIRGMREPKIKKPLVPNLLGIKTVSEISWQGSAGASAYDIERSESKKGPWITVGFNISDADKFYNPLFNDNTAKIGESYYYRVKAKNSAGESGYSNIVGPVNVEHLSLIDEMKNTTVTYFYNGNLTLETDNDREFKEIKSRLGVPENSEVIYYVPGKIINFSLRSFSQGEKSSLIFFVSRDGYNFKSIDVNKESFYLGSGDYNYWIPSEYKTELVSDKKYTYLKINTYQLNQFARLKIDYIPFK